MLWEAKLTNGIGAGIVHNTPMYIYQKRTGSRPRSNLCKQCKAKEDNKDCTT